MNRIILAGLALALACGCKEDAATKTEMPPPMVTVAPPLADTVTRYEYFSGRATSPAQVEVRAQVSGPLVKIFFTPGSEVKEGDPLFEIDPIPFRVALRQAEAQVQAAKARFQTMTAEVARLDVGRRTLAVTQEDYEKAVGQKAEAEAAIQGTQAKVDLAKLDLQYTRINAPLAGVIGDKLVDVGNLIVGGPGTTTLMTTIVSVDPIDVAFDVDENTLQRLEQAVRDGTIKLVQSDAIPVEASLAVHGNKYPLKGVINFRNNQVDPKTGTIRVKASIPNPKPESGPRVVTPGNFVRVRVPVGQPARALLVPEAALLSDLGSKYLFVVGSDNKAVRLDAVLGPSKGEMRVVDSVQGESEPQPRPLRPDEKVIVGGLQRVRPGLTVDPKARP